MIKKAAARCMIRSTVQTEVTAWKTFVKSVKVNCLAHGPLLFEPCCIMSLFSSKRGYVRPRKDGQHRLSMIERPT